MLVLDFNITEAGGKLQILDGSEYKLFEDKYIICKQMEKFMIN